MIMMVVYDDEMVCFAFWPLPPRFPRQVSITFFVERRTFSSTFGTMSICHLPMGDLKPSSLVQPLCKESKVCGCVGVWNGHESPEGVYWMVVLSGFVCLSKDSL